MFGMSHCLFHFAGLGFVLLVFCVLCIKTSAVTTRWWHFLPLSTQPTNPKSAPTKAKAKESKMEAFFQLYLSPTLKEHSNLPNDIIQPNSTMVVTAPTAVPSTSVYNSAGQALQSKVPTTLKSHVHFHSQKAMHQRTWIFLHSLLLLIDVEKLALKLMRYVVYNVWCALLISMSLTQTASYHVHRRLPYRSLPYYVKV